MKIKKRSKVKYEDEFADEENEQNNEDDDKPNENIYEKSSNAFKKINFKSLIFLFILFIFISSDIFIEQILDKFGDTVEHNNPTSKGVLIQGIMLVLGFAILDTLVNYNLI